MCFSCINCFSSWISGRIIYTEFKWNQCSLSLSTKWSKVRQGDLIIRIYSETNQYIVYFISETVNSDTKERKKRRREQRHKIKTSTVTLMYITIRNWDLAPFAVYCFRNWFFLFITKTTATATTTTTKTTIDHHNTLIVYCIAELHCIIRFSSIKFNKLFLVLLILLRVLFLSDLLILFKIFCPVI